MYLNHFMKIRPILCVQGHTKYLKILWPAQKMTKAGAGDAAATGPPSNMCRNFVMTEFDFIRQNVTKTSNFYENLLM